MKTARLLSLAALVFALVVAGATPTLAAVVLAYSGYIGGYALDYATFIVVDATGAAYVTGNTDSDETRFPVAVGPDLTYNKATDAFVAKVGADGAGLVFCGYIGGSDLEWSYSIALDADGNIYVTGVTQSDENSFPVRIGPDLTGSRGPVGIVDGFIARMRPDAIGLSYAGYIGGADFDAGLALVATSDGSAYVAGATNTADGTFPVLVGPDLSFNGQPNDAFIARVAPDGGGLVYSGFIGGAGQDVGYGLAVDAFGSACLVGQTSSAETAGFPVSIGPDLSFNGGAKDGFVASVSADGTALVHAGYIGGDGDDVSGSVAVDSAGSAYASGSTSSSEATFPVGVGPDASYNGGIRDVTVLKLAPDGISLVYAGYIGGDGDEPAAFLAVDASGCAYVAGATASTEATFPVRFGPDVSANGGFDGFVAKVSADGAGLVYSGFIGGASDDLAYSVNLDTDGNAYIAGKTRSDQATFPIVVGPDLTFNDANGSGDAFVEKVVETSCAALPGEIALLRAVKAPGAIADVAMTWIADPGARGYNIWYVLAKADIPYADQKDQPPAIGVAGCAAPAPASGPACTDVGAVPRGSPSVLFYQVRAFCDPANEGP